jgi:predicted negative regulator of RcsB-dependent stress response
MSLNDADQLDGLKSFTHKYGSSIISGILIALIAFFGWEYWQKKQLVTAQTETARVQLLIEDSKNAANDKNALTNLGLSADKILKEAPDSVHAIQAQMLLAKVAYDKADYAAAEKALQKVVNSKVEDQGLIQLVKLRLGYSQLAQKKYDVALKTFASVNEPSFKATADEARGDVFVAKNDIENAKKAYQSAWDALVERQQERPILQIKLESVGVLVDDPEIERPIIETQADEVE